MPGEEEGFYRLWRVTLSLSPLPVTVGPGCGGGSTQEAAGPSDTGRAYNQLVSGIGHHWVAMLGAGFHWRQKET